MSESSRPHGLQPARLLRPWDFPGKNTGVGGHCFTKSRASLISGPDTQATIPTQKFLLP